ncbi:MAG TPA: glycosyltransferase family A protein, partial [Candidatus Udaeobacter sp.]|nr:glycosyltransferase family A protein [Candidatus Udaeobacter sp.]
MRTLGVVIPCYRQERFLPRTVAALDRIPAGWAADGVLVMAATGGGLITSPAPPFEPGPESGWRTLRPAESRGGAPLTPGAARMHGLAACGGDWVLFVDADVEVDAAWLARALETIDAAEREGEASRLAGLWGRIEEWFIDGIDERRGSPD